MTDAVSSSDDPSSIDALAAALRQQGYLADRRTATSAFLALKMERPLLLEGDAGVGKTALAHALAAHFGTSVIRLQCYDGLDIAQAAYEWNYAKQLLAIQSGKAQAEIYARDFLLARPLLQAIEQAQERRVVLLIDELDRADEPFEAYLLEFLSDFQISIPEYQVIRAVKRPIVVITSNRTREIHDAIRRRCLYQWLDYPDRERELAIIRSKLPNISPRLSAEIVAFVSELREVELFKRPGIAETLDWCTALYYLDRTSLDPDSISETLGALLKYEDDLARIDAPAIEQMLGRARASLSVDDADQ